MVIEEIKKRRSCRAFSDKEVSDKMIEEIIKAGQFAPTAKNNRAVEFIVVKDKTTKNKIFEITGQAFVKEAAVLIIPVTDTNKTDFAIEDLSVATENMLLQATALGLGSVWKNVKWKEEEIKNLLLIPSNYKLINIILIGFPKQELNPHKDEDFDRNKIHYEKW